MYYTHTHTRICKRFLEFTRSTRVSLDTKGLRPVTAP